MKKLSLLVVILLVTFAGCKKDKVDQGAIDNKLILAYIQVHYPTAKPTGSGLYYVVDTLGGATRPIYTSTVYVKYRGYLLDGTQFDSSYEGSEQPAQFTIGGVVPGFGEGLKLFGKGGKGKLIIPSTLGYGVTAMPGIPANSVIIFDIELVNFL